jgi:hypothetical protein
VVQEDGVIRAAADADVDEIVFGEGGGVAGLGLRLRERGPESLGQRPPRGRVLDLPREVEDVGREGADRVGLEVGGGGRGVDVQGPGWPGSSGLTYVRKSVR